MRNVDSIFSFALRFHPDIADLSPNEFRRSCYVQLLRREPEASLPDIFFPTFDDRARYWGHVIKSEEFGSHSLPLHEDIQSRICRSLGWQLNNSAFHYACRYVASTSGSYSAFIERIVTALGQNSMSRADIVHTIESYSDVALIRSLLDGLIDMSAEFTMAVNELDLMKGRLSALETALMPTTSLPDAAPPAPAAAEAEAPVPKTSKMPVAKAVPAKARTVAPAKGETA